MYDFISRLEVQSNYVATFQKKNGSRMCLMRHDNEYELVTDGGKSHMEHNILHFCREGLRIGNITLIKGALPER